MVREKRKEARRRQADCWYCARARVRRWTSQSEAGAGRRDTTHTTTAASQEVVEYRRKTDGGHLHHGTQAEDGGRAQCPPKPGTQPWETGPGPGTAAWEGLTGR
jgi:hypothetical protein